MYVYNNATNVVDAVTHLTSLTLGSALPIASGGTGSNSATFSGANITSLNATAVSSGILAVGNGGTGATSLNAEAVVIGNSTSAVKFVAPGTTGNVLTSNGTAWLSVVPASGGTTIPAGTVMIFGQTAAPTGFTKLTNQDNAALRVVSGTASTGGSVDFTTAFASQTPTGSVSITAVSGSAGNTTLSTPQIPSHNHTVPFLNTSTGPGGDPPAKTSAGPVSPVNTSSTGGGGAHSHPFSFSSGSGTFSGNAINLAVKYVDVIRATKD
jgi:hypothetical protein